MDDALYDALTPVLSIPTLPAALSALVSRPPSGRREDEDKQRERLSSHADAFRRSLSRDRPRYEDEEEREKLGGLRQCAWTRLDNIDAGEEENQRLELRVGKRRKRKVGGRGDGGGDGEHPQLKGLAVSLIYEKDTFQFVIYTRSLGSDLPKRKRITATTYQRTTESREESAILLSKSSTAALKAFTAYLRDTFAVAAVYPFEPSSSLMQSTLEKYLGTIRASLPDAGDTSSEAILQNFSNIIGKIELTFSFSHPVAKGLKSLHVAVPATSFLTWYMPTEASRGGHRGRRKTFLGSLAGWIRTKSGLGLPILYEKDGQDNHKEGDDDSDSDSDNNDDDPRRGKAAPASVMMKISKISTEAYTISAASGVKFKSRAVHAAEVAGAGADSDRDGEENDNCVRRANKDLLLAFIDYARCEANGRDAPSTT
ncbi:hypothetical protein CLAIMM_02370 [Cladophialophora immunda]|nr:hypothetical protein CLAIMM_02370 [Cladophialophora immunda]